MRLEMLSELVYIVWNERMEEGREFKIVVVDATTRNEQNPKEIGARNMRIHERR